MKTAMNGALRDAVKSGREADDLRYFLLILICCALVFFFSTNSFASTLSSSSRNVSASQTTRKANMVRAADTALLLAQASERATRAENDRKALLVAENTKQTKNGQAKPAQNKGKNKGKTPEPKPVAPQAQPWAFEASLGGPVGVDGIDGKSMHQRAVQGVKPLAKSGESEEKGKRAGDGLDLRVTRESQTWRSESAELSTRRAGEFVPLESQHRVQAFSRVEEDNVAFGMGPEVIVKDQTQGGAHHLNSQQPDVEAGVGMRLEIGF